MDPASGPAGILGRCRAHAASPCRRPRQLQTQPGNLLPERPQLHDLVVQLIQLVLEGRHPLGSLRELAQIVQGTLQGLSAAPTPQS